MPDDRKIALEIVTPAGVVVREWVDEVEAPGADGYFGVLPGHTPFLSQLKIGTVRYRIGRENFFVAVTWGFAEVLPHKVTLLANTAELARDIDLERAETARRRAEERMREFGVAYDLERARESFERAQSRLETAKRAQQQRLAP